MLPRWIRPLTIVAVALALVPFACVARSRISKSEAPRVHLIQDMDNQGRFKGQQPNPWFADTRAMRPPVEGTIARGALALDDHYFRGLAGGDYATTFPPQVRVTEPFIQRGRERYDIFCAPCHGLSGYGDGMVARRADKLQQGTWIPPSSLHIEPASTRSVGHIYNSIDNGIRSMSAYGPQIDVDDRWAIVAYVRALQRSQSARVADVPADKRATLR